MCKRGLTPADGLTSSFYNETEYLHGNTFLPYLNNVIYPNSTYTTNFETLDKMLLIEATEDTVVYPYQAEQFGGWEFTDDPKNLTLYSMTQAPFYNKFGLKTMNEAGKISFNSFKGNHLQFSNDFWNTQVLPHLK